MRRRVHEILTSTRPDDRGARIVGVALLLLIAVNVVASIVETDPSFAHLRDGPFFYFEWVSVAVFTVEYVLRLWSCVEDPRYRGWGGRLRYGLRPLLLIDLLAIAPFYMTLLAPGAIDLRFVRALRLARLFRLLRFGRFADAGVTLLHVVRAKRDDLVVSLVLVVLAMVIAAGAIYVVEHGEPDTQFTSIPQAMWWSIVTITTVGYGDMTPATAMGRVIAGAVAFIGICAIAMPVGIISTGYIAELERRKAAGDTAPARCPHCGGALEGPGAAVDDPP